MSAKELKHAEKEARAEQLKSQPHDLHPAGGIHDTFVYEPISTTEYAYKTVTGAKAIVLLNVEYEDQENRKRPHWSIDVDGQKHYFNRKPPKRWLFKLPIREIVEQWIKSSKASLKEKELWDVNGVFLRVFLDFPREHEFKPTQLFITESWLAELLYAFFYLSIQGEFGGGKTVTSDAVWMICHHGVSANPSASFIARGIDSQKLTPFVDELDRVGGSQLLAVYRQGQRRGTPWSRINPDSLDPETFVVASAKGYTVYASAEEALQTRTVPIHVRETEQVEYPVVNIDKVAFAREVMTENWLWYMDSILSIREKHSETLKVLRSELDLIARLAPSNQEVDVKQTANEARETLFNKKAALLKRQQVKQVTGRNVELMYMCFVVSNIIGVDCDKDLELTFTQKILEEGERTELGFLGLLKETLAGLYHERKNDKSYITKDGYVKVSNKECYDCFNKKLKDKYGQGVSPATFKGYILQFGFTSGVNRKKLEVPIPDDGVQSRLCNIFTRRVMRKLSVEETEGFSLGSIRFLSGPHTLAIEECHKAPCSICEQESDIRRYFTDFDKKQQDLCDGCSEKIIKKMEVPPTPSGEMDKFLQKEKKKETPPERLSETEEKPEDVTIKPKTKVIGVTEEDGLRLFVSSLSPEKKAFLKMVKHITPLKEPANGECYVCEKNKDLTWQIGVADDVTKGHWGFLCMGCAPKVMMMNQGENKE